MLTDQGWTYEKDGASVAQDRRDPAGPVSASRARRTQDIDKLDLKDDVLRRANGFYTYFAADIAYHRNKFEVRGFDKVINIWGADHHGHVARLKGALDALGLDGTNRLDIVLMQLVKLAAATARWSVCPSAPARPSPSHDLLDEIPRGRLPATSSTPSPTPQMDFDLGPGRARGQREPRLLCPVRPRPYLLPARDAWRTRAAASRAADKADLSLLSGEQERALIKELANFREEIRMAARDYDPSHINRYLMRAGRRVPPLLQRLPHQGRDGRRGERPSAARRRDPSGARQRPDDPRPEQAREDVSTHYIQIYNQEEDSRSAALFPLPISTRTAAAEVRNITASAQSEAGMV